MKFHAAGHTRLKRIALVALLVTGSLAAVLVFKKPRGADAAGGGTVFKTSPSQAVARAGAVVPASGAIHLTNGFVGAASLMGTNGAREFDIRVNPYAAALREPGRAKRAWDTNFLTAHISITTNDAIQFELTGGVIAAGVVKIIQRDENGLTYISGELSAPEPGKFFFLRPPAGGRAGSAAGVIEFPMSKTAYRIEPTGNNGTPELWQRRLDEVICMEMPLAADSVLNDPQNAPPLRPDLDPEYVPYYNSNIVSLQSFPGSPAVLLLDFFGGYTPTWGGVTYPAPNVSNAQIRDLWKRVAEDFMPFNINVTTDKKVYESAPAASRQRCVFSPNISTLGSGAAGVAYIGSWNWGSDTVCWSIYTSGKAGGEVGAHEPGHTLGLGHQGTSTSGYFSGQGSAPTGWGPIMGAGYYQPVITWAKGEYQDANNTEDELAIILTYNNVAYRTDDAGSTLATSRYLEIFTNATASAEGVIETAGDTDAFQFTTSGGAVSLTANPVGDWANLAVVATLADASDTIIASNNPQNIISASISTNLPAGTYTFRVTGTGRNSPLTNGFSSYASLGYYSVTGSVAGARLPTRLAVNERSPNGTVVGTVTSTNLGVDALNYVVTAGNSNNAFALDNNGVLTVANSAALNYANLSYNSQLAVQFELFVNIVDTTNPALTENNRRVVVQLIQVPLPVAKLVHRWSFNDATDSIGGANATLVGAATFSGGKLNIPGGAARANCATVNLTNDFGTNISLTIEGWFTMTTLQDWSKVWMFGRANGGTEPGLAYIDFTPRPGADGNVPSMALNTGLRSAEVNTRTGDNPALLTTGVEYHAACVYDSVSNVMSLYINGQLADTAAMNMANLTQLFENEGYFGAPVNYGDPNLNGAINEIRIYNGPVTAEQIAINYAAGPNSVVTNSGSVVALRLVVANTSMMSLTSQAFSVFADYANITNVNVTGASGLVFTLGNSNILPVTSPGALRAVVPGVTTFTATFGGTNVTRSFTVTNAPLTIAHRWSFNDGTDSIGGANATLIGATFAGGQLQLPGGAARTNCASVNLANTLNSTVSLTVESWFTMNALQDWAKVWMFGTAANGSGEPWLSYVEFTPRAGAGGNVPSTSFNPANGGTEFNTRGGTDPALMTTGTQYYAVTTYDASNNLVSLYINGVLVDTNTMGGGNISQLSPVSEGYFGSVVNYGDPSLNGSINELRIWKGVLPASQIAFDASAGPNTLVTNPGALTAVRLIVTNNVMPRGSSQPTSVFADFLNYSNLNVGASLGVAYSSSNSGIVVVNSSGVLSAVGAGTTSVTASYGGLNSTQIITVYGAPILRHRWSFSDATDSIGGANATLVGAATISGGKLNVPGGSPRVNAATVNITNTLATNYSLTIEGWFTMTTLQNWAKVWMFGTPNGGTQPGLAYVDFTPRRGDGTSVPSISLDTGLTTELNTSGGSNPAIMSAGIEYYAAAVYNTASNTMSLYLNGALADSATMGGGNITQLAATEAWFGASVYWGDNNLNGAINELRIWDGPLTASQIATNFALGANTLPRPNLATAKNSGVLALSWPDAFAGFTVQTCSNLVTASWVPVPTAPAWSNGIYSVNLPLTKTNAAGFFRLIK